MQISFRTVPNAFCLEICFPSCSAPTCCEKCCRVAVVLRRAASCCVSCCCRAASCCVVLRAVCSELRLSVPNRAAACRILLWTQKHLHGTRKLENASTIAMCCRFCSEINQNMQDLHWKPLKCLDWPWFSLIWNQTLEIYMISFNFLRKRARNLWIDMNSFDSLCCGTIHMFV